MCLAWLQPWSCWGLEQRPLTRQCLQIWNARSGPVTWTQINFESACYSWLAVLNSHKTPLVKSVKPSIVVRPQQSGEEHGSNAAVKFSNPK